MLVKASKHLVIDASVARSSGGENAMYPTSKNCRDFLKAVLEVMSLCRYDTRDKGRVG